MPVEPFPGATETRSKDIKEDHATQLLFVPEVHILVTWLCCWYSLAQSIPSLAQEAARLTQPVDNHARVTLPATVHPLANARNDRGAASPDMQLDRLQMILKRSPQQEASLQQLLHDMHTPGTANFHKWLTPEQFGQQFGPSDQDVQTIEDWLQTQGFQVLKVNPGKQTLEISGTVGALQQAFHTSIHKYEVNGRAALRQCSCSGDSRRAGAGIRRLCFAE